MKLYALAAIVALTNGLHIHGDGPAGGPKGDGEGQGPPPHGDDGPHGGDGGDAKPDPCDILPQFIDESGDAPTVDMDGLRQLVEEIGEEMASEADILEHWAKCKAGGEKGPCDDLPDPCADVFPGAHCDVELPCTGDDDTEECWDNLTDDAWTAWDECTAAVDWEAAYAECWVGDEAAALEACWEEEYAGHEPEGDGDAEGLDPHPCDEHWPCQDDPENEDCYLNADWTAYEDCYCEHHADDCAAVDAYCEENPEECDFGDDEAAAE